MATIVPLRRLTVDQIDAFVPVATRVPKRQFGAMRGRARVTRAFFAPLSPEELERWYGKP